MFPAEGRAYAKSEVGEGLALLINGKETRRGGSRVGKVNSEMQWDRRDGNGPDHARWGNQGMLPCRGDPLG